MVIEYAYFYFYALLLAFLTQSAWLVFRTWRGPSARRTRAINGTLVLLSLLATFVAAEGYFYFFVDITDGAMQTLTSRRWVDRHLPQPFGTPRGRQLGDPAAANKPAVSILVIGDSIAYGQGVKREDDLFSSILERGLREHGLDAAVFNVSRLGWHTAEEASVLQQIARDGHRFDLVVLSYCLNDIGAFVEPTPSYSEAQQRLMTPPSSVDGLVKRSFVASWLYNRSVVLTSPALKEMERRVVEAYRDPATFGMHAQELLAFKATVDAMGGRLVVVTFPHFVAPWEKYTYRDIHRGLIAFWGSLGVKDLDLLETYERYPSEGFRASSLDTHPNAFAHRLAAQRLLEELTP
jgi:lysophospholipase L1-like esterase